MINKTKSNLVHPRKFPSWVSRTEDNMHLLHQRRSKFSQKPWPSRSQSKLLADTKTDFQLVYYLIAFIFPIDLLFFEKSRILFIMKRQFIFFFTPVVCYPEWNIIPIFVWKIVISLCIEKPISFRGKEKTKISLVFCKDRTEA